MNVNVIKIVMIYIQIT